MSWDTERFYLQAPPAQISDKDGLLWIWYRQTRPEYLVQLARELGPPLSPERKAEMSEKFSGCWSGGPEALAYAKRRHRGLT